MPGVLKQTRIEVTVPAKLTFTFSDDEWDACEDDVARTALIDDAMAEGFHEDMELAPFCDDWTVVS